MKAYRTRGDGIDALELSELPAPAAKADEILVKMTAASLNYRDLLVVKGVDKWKTDAPRIPVSDGAGEVVAVGGNVTKWKKGDRVAGIFLPKWLDGELTDENGVAPLGGRSADGVLAECVIFNQESVVRIPQNLTDEEASTLPVAAITAWHAIRRSGVKSGETVLIQGTGGVSLFALQFAHALGALPVVTSSSDEKLERVKNELGAWATINYRTFPDWDAEALKLTGGKGVDHVIEVVGGENLNRSLNAVKVSGSISFIGLIAGLSGKIDTFQFVNKNVNLYGIETGSRRMFEEMNRFIETHRIKPVIDRTFGFEEAPEALKYLESGAHFGKVVVRF
jgi:NADPH:quinone reductase-like Zn-dependent oxidoreductase